MSDSFGNQKEWDQLQAELARLRNERSDLHNWFKHRHVTGSLSLEEIDAMSPKDWANHTYERKAEQVDALQSQLHQRDTALNAAREALEKSKSLLEKNNGQHGESACWSHDKKHEGQNRAAWLIEENDSHVKNHIDHALSQIQAVKP